MAKPSVFPLRMRDPRLRELLREVARRDHLSQNELIEQAVENEVVVRGGLIAEELAAASLRLAQLSAPEMSAIVARSLEEFAQGEGGPDPLQARALATDLRADHPMRVVASRHDPHGVMAAFHAGA